MEKFLYYNELIDIYGKLLTDKNLKIMEYYYKENYSMQEIANILKVSKSYIGSTIKSSEIKLEELENNLKVYQRKLIVRDLLNEEDINIIKNKLRELY